MKIIVIGAGVVGVTTAYFLAQSGHEVVVIDQQESVAAEASQANGGQLSYDFASPMATPSILGKLPSILTGRDIAFRVRPAFDSNFIAWSLRFVQNCLPAKARVNERELSRLAHISGRTLKEILSQTDLDFAHRKSGKLVIFEDASSFKAARANIQQTENRKARFDVMSAAECLKIEPALCHHTGKIQGGVFAAFDEVGDTALFTLRLAELSKNIYGVKFLMGECVHSFQHQDHRVCSVKTSKNEALEADAYICCMGADERRLLAHLGMKSAVYPVKGYSLTLPLGTCVPEVAITDAKRKLVYSRIGQNIRIAGFADFGFKSPKEDQKRIERLRMEAASAMPLLADFNSQEGTTWVGLRPSTPNSLPIVQKSKFDNLYLNMGHGMFGWTLAAGAAKSITQDFLPPTQESTSPVVNAA